MKLPPSRAAAFLRDPGAVRVVLLHGDDEGLIRQRADALTVLVAGAGDDPFRVAWLDDSSHGRLLEEASAIAMLGGRRVVRVRGVNDTLLADVEGVMAGPGDSLVVLEAPAVTRRSKLLAAVEAAPLGATLACYPEEPAELRASIAARLDAAGIRADPDALDWLRDHLGGDAAATRGELEKLVLFAGGERRLDLDAVRECVGDQAATSMDDAVYAATLGDVGAADRNVERAFAEGMSSVGVVRALLMHLARMHQARGMVDAGLSAEAAAKALRPPVFWKRERDMARSLAAWPTQALSGALAEVRRAELACKQTGAPDGVLARRLVLAVARQSAARQGAARQGAVRRR